MPYTPTDRTSINVILSNDLSGTLDNPSVISIANIKNGILSVQNGGTGLSELTSGSLLFAKDVNTIVPFTGSNDDIITWSDQSGGWVVKQIDIVEDVNITSEQNQIFEIIDTSHLKNKNFSISFLDNIPNLFLASPTSSNGKLSLRLITSADLPDYYENISIANSDFSGTFSGSYSGVGNFESISGEASRISNLSSSQILDFDDRVISLYNQGPHTFYSASITTASIGTLVVEDLANITGAFEGYFIGDATELENIQTDNIMDLKEVILSYFSGGVGITFDSGTISAPNTIFDITSLDNNIVVSETNNNIYIGLSSSITASKISSEEITTDILNINNLTLQQLSSSYIFSNYISGNINGSFTGTYFGSGENINNIPNTSLENSFIIINGNQINLGDSVQVSGISTVSSSNQNLSAIIDASGSILTLAVSNNPSFSSLTSDHVDTNTISASYFHGDGRYITNLNFQNVGNVSADSITSSNFSANDADIYRLGVTILSASSVSGDASGLYNIDANNIVGLESLVQQRFINGSNTTVQENINNEIYFNLNNNINLSSVTASFSGDGSRITNLQSPIFKQFIGTGFSAGDIVSIVNENTIIKSSFLNSEVPYGIISQISGNNIFVQTNGICNIASTFTNSDIGTIVYLGNNGNCIKYEDIPLNSYAVEIGTLVSTNKVVLNFKKLWKIK